MAVVVITSGLFTSEDHRAARESDLWIWYFVNE